MVESAEDGLITLTQPDYECLVLGRWRWQDQFNATNATYHHAVGDRRGNAKALHIEDEELEV